MSITGKINEDTVQESFSPFRADGILHFLALIHLLPASLGAADILLSLKNRKQNQPLFLTATFPSYSLFQEQPCDLTSGIGLKGRPHRARPPWVPPSTSPASARRSPGPHRASSMEAENLSYFYTWFPSLYLSSNTLKPTLVPVTSQLNSIVEAASSDKVTPRQRHCGRRSK